MTDDVREIIALIDDLSEDQANEVLIGLIGEVSGDNELVKELLLTVLEGVRDINAEPSATPQRGTCVVCLDRPSTYAVIPCGHLCLCRDCSAALPAKAPCPICRARTHRHMRIHDVGAPPSAPGSPPAAPGPDPDIVWYTPFTAAGREYLRDSLDRVYDIENPEVVIGSWGAGYVCENVCGFAGSFKECLEHEATCTQQRPQFEWLQTRLEAVRLTLMPETRFDPRTYPDGSS